MWKISSHKEGEHDFGNQLKQVIGLNDKECTSLGKLLKDSVVGKQTLTAFLCVLPWPNSVMHFPLSFYELSFKCTVNCLKA